MGPLAAGGVGCELAPRERLLTSGSGSYGVTPSASMIVLSVLLNTLSIVS